ncbi:peptide chain release factor 2 [Patescibacteria group bacterium]|nr:peptide chain release factor 2 [Patescibacteria group bacterium]
MHELVKSLEELYLKLSEMRGMLKIEESEVKINELTSESSKPGFWDDTENATRVSKELGELQQEVDNYKKLRVAVGDLLEMAKMDEVDKDVNLREDLEKQFESTKKQIMDLEFYTLMDGRHDVANAIVGVYAGSGGTEAQDWAEMLLRMILRYCEKKNWKTTILDESRGSEAGIKSSTIRVEGRYAYGHLKSEHGTHRLVRISPFDAEKMRHTSFAGIEVIPEIEHEDFELDEKDLRIDTFMAGGHGGQSVNTTYSAVRIVHTPTGTTVQCQNERSQLQNKETALKILKSKLQKLKEDEEESERLKIRGEHKSAEWGNQIRSYVLQPYKMVKDLRSRFETTDPEVVLDGGLDGFVEAYLRWLKE